MSANKFFESLDITSRRNFLKIAAMAGVSSSVLFAPASSFAFGKATDTLNVALSLEFEAIAAYKAGAALLSGDVLELAKKFLGNHEQHRDALVATIGKLGGKPIAEPKFDAGKTLAKTSVKELKDAGNVLNLAAELERQATKAYLGVIPQLEKLEIAQAAAKIAADEATHTAILESALKTYKGGSYLA